MMTDENVEPEVPVEPEEKEEPVSPVETVQPVDMIGDANLAAKRLEEANKVFAQNLDRQEALRVETTLGGKSDAVGVKKEVSDEEYARKILAGERP